MTSSTACSALCASTVIGHSKDGGSPCFCRPRRDCSGKVGASAASLRIGQDFEQNAYYETVGQKRRQERRSAHQQDLEAYGCHYLKQ